MIKMQLPVITPIDIAKITALSADEVQGYGLKKIKVVETLSKTFQDDANDFYEQENSNMDDILEQNGFLQQEMSDFVASITQLKKEMVPFIQLVSENAEKKKNISETAEQKSEKNKDSLQSFENSLKQIDRKREDIVAQMDTKILCKLLLFIIQKVNLEDPSSSNRNAELFNWILGCLFLERKGVNNFLSEKKVVVKSASPFSIICGAKNKVRVELWQSFKEHVFLNNNGNVFLDLLKKLNSNNISDFQLMLVDELLESKKAILKQITSLDQKFQVHLIFDVVDLLSHGNEIKKKIQEQYQGMDQNQYDSSNKKAARERYQLLKTNNDEMKVNLEKLDVILQSLMTSGKLEHDEIETKISASTSQQQTMSAKSNGQGGIVIQVGDKFLLKMKDEEDKKIQSNLIMTNASLSIQSNQAAQNLIIEKQQAQQEKQEDEIKLKLKKEVQIEDQKQLEEKKKAQQKTKDEEADQQAKQDEQPQQAINEDDDDDQHEDKDVIAPPQNDIEKNIQKTMFAKQLFNNKNKGKKETKAKVSIFEQLANSKKPSR